MNEIEAKVSDITCQLETFLEKNESKENQMKILQKQIKNMEHYIMKNNELNENDYINNANSNQNLEQFNDYVRKGLNHSNDNIEQKSLTSANDSAGHSVTPYLHKQIISLLHEYCPFRQLASIENISTNSVDYLIENDNTTFGWAGEIEKRDVTDISKITKLSIHTHELYAQPKATQRLLDDSEVNIDAWISAKIAESFAKAENEAFLNGDGNKKPHGFLTKKNEYKSVKSANEKINAEDILKMINSLPEQFMSNATFIMNRLTLSNLQALTDSNNRFIWQHSLSDPLKQTLFGVPVVIVKEMPNAEKDKCSIALADFKSAYKIIDRSHINLIRDPYTDKPFVKFYAVKRVGGDVFNKNAVVTLTH